MARNPTGDASYYYIFERLKELRNDFLNLGTAVRAQLELAMRRRDLVAKLPMDTLESINAICEAEATIVQLTIDWHSTSGTYAELNSLVNPARKKS